MNLNEIQQSLIDKVSEKFNPKNNLVITDNTNISHDLNLDSLQLMELVAEIEDSYSVSVPLEDIGTIRTISDAAKLVHSLLKGKN